MYFGSIEIYREKISGSLSLERETLYISDDQKRIALVDTKTYDGGVVSSPVSDIRYQLGNHLGSCSLELDDSADIISYEEFHPFGTSAYRLGSTSTEVSLKRYRYVGKERDEESGLYYYGARYYAAWLCRFVSVDPLKDDYPYYTPFQYAGNKPISYIDLDGLEEYKDYDEYAMAFGELAMPKDKWDGSDGAWLTSDRKNRSENWNRANEFNTKNERMVYKAFEQILDYYVWVQQEFDKKGHEILWIKGAFSLVYDLTEAFDRGKVTTGNWHIKDKNIIDPKTKNLLQDLNEGIAKYAITKFNDLLYGANSMIPLKGEKAMYYDIDFIFNEQSWVAKKIYSQHAVDSIEINQMNEMASKSLGLGTLVSMGAESYIPSFADYGVSLNTGDYGENGRIEIPILMLYPNQYKPKYTPGLESKTNSLGFLTGSALADFQKANIYVHKIFNKYGK